MTTSDRMTEGLSLGKYRLESEIGRGGMGVIYAALDPALDRRVAVKCIDRRRFEQDPTFERRFIEEARALARLSHPAIVTVFDFGQHEHLTYLVMELLEGENAAARLERGEPFAVDETLCIARQITRALAHTHARGLIHRDIKPSNLFLTHEGDIKLIDFGIARVPTAAEHRMTTAGIMVGSLAYMPPEQLIDARNVTERSDIYALGVTLYEMLTGSLPFYHEALGAFLLKMLQEEPPPIRDLCPDIPESLATIIDTAMRKDPEQRYATMAEMAAAIDALAQPIEDARPAQVRQTENRDRETTEVLLQRLAAEPSPPDARVGQIQAILETVSQEVPGVLRLIAFDLATGSDLGQVARSNTLDLVTTMRANREIISQKRAALTRLHLEGEAIDDIVMTLSDEIHILRLAPETQCLLYAEAERESTNLAILRRSLQRHSLLIRDTLLRVGA